jgi:hypothetical protein
MNYLPKDSILILHPSAPLFLATRRQFLPVVVNLWWVRLIDKTKKRERRVRSEKKTSSCVSQWMYKEMGPSTQGNEGPPDTATYSWLSRANVTEMKKSFAVINYIKK